MPSSRFLDLGVGAGRTTVHVLPLVREYVGIDRSAAMVEACRRRVGAHARARLLALDARDLRALGPEPFDVVWFSLNGIDAMGRRGRRRAIAEARRVLAPGGTFCFSSHNLRSVPDLLAFRVGRHPLRMPRRARRACRLRRANGPPSRYEGRDGAFVRDGSLDGRLANYHVRPEAQVRDLLAAGFRSVAVLDACGREVAGGPALAAVRDRWLTYVCEA